MDASLKRDHGAGNPVQHQLHMPVAGQFPDHLMQLEIDLGINGKVRDRLRAAATTT
jgi:hypothetical protein